jgi:hypothetical protein
MCQAITCVVGFGPGHGELTVITAMFGALTSSFSGSSSGSGLLSASTSDNPPKKTLRKSSSQAGPTSLNTLSRVAISLEYASVRHQSHCPLGMYVIPFADDPFIWDAVLFIHQGEIRVPFVSYHTHSEARLLHRLHPKVSFDVSSQLPRTTANSALHHRCLSSAHFSSRWNLQPRSQVQSLAVCHIATLGSFMASFCLASPNEHHVYDVLYYIKGSFKKHTLDQIKESDCLNKEAFRCVTSLPHADSSADCLG